ncbi:MAG: thiamine biosynthesis protein [Thaumarchaeota archaeon]|nr:thiamine biosynthesis protein [Nitrososphaerota archaeon]
MKDEVLIIVFPSVFSKNKTNFLITNIKKVLRIQNQKFRKVRKEGDVITVEADDPVFASSAINTLFGIKGVAIAKQVTNDFESIVNGISKVAKDIFLKGERFLLQVEGDAKGFTTKDVELAATSSVIEKTVGMGIKPGTSKKYDRKLYVCLTKLNAYICIYYDNGLGGVPNNSQNEEIICCVFDELSAVSCLETIKQGFDVKIIVCYNKDSELLHLVKIVNQIIRRTVKPKINLDFYKICNNKKLAPLLLTEITSKILIRIASTSGIKRISFSTSPLIYPIDFAENLTGQAFDKNLIPYFPLSGLDDNVFESAKEIGLEKYLSNIRKLGNIKFQNSKQPTKIIERIVNESIMNKKTVAVNIGPNNVHEILDEVRLDG